MNVAVLGGTGAFGSALARRLVEAGVDVTIGSRDLARAAATAAEVGAARGATNADAVTGADLVLLAVDASAALQTAAELADVIGETPVLSVCQRAPLHERRRLCPPMSRCRWPSGCSRCCAPPSWPGCTRSRRASLKAGKAEGDALVCGDDEAAKAFALELAAKLVTGRALDAGPLASARALEGMTAVIVNLNRRYGGHAGLQIVGL